MRARSFFPLGLMPAVIPAARIPGTAVMPPSSHWKSLMSPARRLRVHGGRFEPAPLVPPHHHVQVLDAVRRPALAGIVESGEADGPPRAGVGDHGDVAEVRAHDVPGG